MKAIEKINALLLQHGKTGAEMSRDLGLSNSAYSLWNTGSTNPSVKNLKRIADYFGVNVSEIADDTEKENPVIVRDGNVKPELSEDERQLLTLYRSMNDAGRIALLAAANGFANSPAYTYKDRLNQVENDRFRRFFFVLLHFYACFGDITKIEKC